MYLVLPMITIVSCSPHDVANKLLIWCLTIITHSAPYEILGDVYFVVLENWWLFGTSLQHQWCLPLYQHQVLRFSDTYTWLQVPRTITDWNKLPENIINSTSLDSFKSSISKLQYWFSIIYLYICIYTLFLLFALLAINCTYY